MKQAVIGIIFNEDRSSVLILLRRDVPIWVFPGGGVDANESPDEAVIREVLEETGLNVVIKKKIGEYTPMNRLTCLTHVYECTVVSGTPKTSNEAREVKFCKIDQLPWNFLFVHDEWLKDAQKNASEIIKRPITSANYWMLWKYLWKHPILVLRYLLARLGLPINTR